jgi:hypothetical protein
VNLIWEYTTDAKLNIGAISAMGRSTIFSCNIWLHIRERERERITRSLQFLATMFGFTSDRE